MARETLAQRIARQQRERPPRNGKAHAPAAPVPPATPRRPAAVPPYCPFPVETLPRPLDALVHHGSLALGCDPTYIALPAMSVCASLIGTTRYLALKRSWKEPAVIWSGVIGESGSLKSPAISLAVDPFIQIQTRLRTQHKCDMVVYAQQYDEWAANKKEYDKAVRSRKEGEPEPAPPGDEPEKPVERRIIISDTTIEKVAAILQDNPTGVLLWRDELDAWLQSFARYKGSSGGNDRAQWLEMHGARAVIIDRKTGEPRTIIVPRAAVSIVGGIQPYTLAQAMDRGARESGLAARLLLAWPPRRPKRWTEDEVPEPVEAAYARLLDRLVALTHVRTSEGERRPWLITLDDAAKAAWVRWYDEWAAEQSCAEGEIAASWAKLEAYSARLALVHHVCSRLSDDQDDQAPLCVESMESAITLTRWLAAESQRVYLMLDESDDARADRRLLEMIRARGGSITIRELMRGSRRYPDAAAAEDAMRSLVEAGIARWTTPETAMRGGIPIRAITLYMGADTADTADADQRADGDGLA